MILYIAKLKAKCDKCGIEETLVNERLGTFNIPKNEQRMFFSDLREKGWSISLDNSGWTLCPDCKNRSLIRRIKDWITG